MNDSQCMARLLASGVHDMRNVLAVIRESAGLAQDMAALAGAALPRGERLLAALTEVQSQILQGAALPRAWNSWPRPGARKMKTRVPATWPGSAGFSAAWPRVRPEPPRCVWSAARTRSRSGLRCPAGGLALPAGDF